MGVGVDRRPAGAAEQLAEARVAREVAAEDQRVDEEADQALELRPSRGRRPASRRRNRPGRSSGGAGPGRRRAGSCTASRPPAGRAPAPRRAARAGISGIRSPPRPLGTAGRGRSVGSSSGGTPASCAGPVVELLLQHLALRASRAARRRSRRTGWPARAAARARRGGRPRRAPRPRGSGRRATSRRRRCGASSPGRCARVSPSRIRPARTSGPRARSKGRAASSRTRSRARSAAGPRGGRRDPRRAGAARASRR